MGVCAAHSCGMFGSMWTQPASSSPSRGRWSRQTSPCVCPGLRRHQPRPPSSTCQEATVALDLWSDEDAPEPTTLGIQHRLLTAEQLRRFEGYAAEILTAFGMSLDTPGTRDTPRRFIKGLFDVTNGYDGDPKLVRVFPTECRG